MHAFARRENATNLKLPAGVGDQVANEARARRQLLDRAEKAIPVLTPEALRDNHPSLIPHDLAGTD